jgi:hypothetical protein
MLTPNHSSLDSFLCAAKVIFDRIEVKQHYDEDVNRSLHGLSCCPRLIRLQRSDPNKHGVSSSCAALEVDGAMDANVGPPAVNNPGNAEVSDCCNPEANEMARFAERNHRRRQILAARALRRSRGRESLVDEAVEVKEISGDDSPRVTPLELNDEADITPHDSCLPGLTGSRSSSSRSLLAAPEVSSLTFTAARHCVDSGSALVARCSVGNISVAPVSATNTQGPNKVSSSTASPSIEVPGYPVASFWARLPNAYGAVGNKAVSHGCYMSDEEAVKRSGSKRTSSNSIPPASVGKSDSCSLKLCIDGSGISMQSVDGSAAARAKWHVRRNPHAPPRVPVACA